MRFSGGDWGFELWIALCVPMRRIFEIGETSGVRNLITNFDYKTLTRKEMDACIIR